MRSSALAVSRCAAFTPPEPARCASKASAWPAAVRSPLPLTCAASARVASAGSATLPEPAMATLRRGVSSVFAITSPDPATPIWSMDFACTTTRIFVCSVRLSSSRRWILRMPSSTVVTTLGITLSSAVTVTPSLAPCTISTSAGAERPMPW